MTNPRPVEAPLPAIGERIRFTTQTARHGALETEQREGVVICIWGNGSAPIIDTDHGSCVLECGDTWEAI